MSYINIQKNHLESSNDPHNMELGENHSTGEDWKNNWNHQADDSHSQDSSDNMGNEAEIYGSSDAGIPLENPNLPAGVEDGNDINKLDFGSQYTSPNGMNSSDNLLGTEGANTFKFDLLLNAKPEIYEKHLDGEGRIDWAGVTGENTNYHDHWLDGIGKETIIDFSGSGGDGDKIQIDGHTVTVKVIEELDNKVTLGLYADQGADGTRGNDAHDFDVVGKITVNHDGHFNYGSDVNINAGSVAGAFEFA